MSHTLRRLSVISIACVALFSSGLVLGQTAGATPAPTQFLGEAMPAPRLAFANDVITATIPAATSRYAYSCSQSYAITLTTVVNGVSTTVSTQTVTATNFAAPPTVTWSNVANGSYLATYQVSSNCAASGLYGIDLTSYSGQVTVSRIPGAPTNVSATLATPSVWAPTVSMVVSWTAPVDSGGSAISSYKVVATAATTNAPYCATKAPNILPSGADLGMNTNPCPAATGQTCTARGAVTCTVSGLTIGENYVFAVSATNGIGSGPAGSSSSVTAGGPPSFYLPDAGVGWQNSTPTVTTGDRSVTVSWDPDHFFSDGSPITGYKVYLFGGNLTGIYNTVLLGTMPAGVLTVGVRFPQDVVSMNTVPVSTYTNAPWSMPIIASCTTTQTSCTFDAGIYNEFSYVASVVAVNANGQGPLWRSTPALPYATPEAPTNISWTNGPCPCSVGASWTAPSNVVPADVTHYDVQTAVGTGASVGTFQPLCQAYANSFTFSDSRPGSWTSPFVTNALTSCSAMPLPANAPKASPQGSWTIRVRACNAFVCGPWGTTTWTSPVPLPPALRASTVPGNTTLDVHWVPDPGATAAGVTAYGVLAIPATSDFATYAGPFKYCSYTVSSPETDTCQLTGLTNGTLYKVRVISSGSSTSSSIDTSGTPGGPPSAPQNLAVTAGQDSLAVSWTPPASTGGLPVSSYTATAYDASNNAVGSCTSAVTTPEVDACSITGLAGGPYTVKTTATNAAGAGAAAVSSPVTPTHVTAPSAPTNVTATGGQQTASISWTPPTNNGGAVVTRYDVSLKKNGVVVGNCTYVVATPETDTCTVDGIPADTYDVSVTAVNSIGSSAAGTSSVTVTALPSSPDSPTAVAATSNEDSQTTVTWTPPANNGGSPILSYTAIASDPDGNDIGSCTYAVTSPEADTCVITGLTNGVTYSVKVTATSAGGTSDAALGLDTATPSTGPGVPLEPSATGSIFHADISWTPPSSDGGSPIVDYLVHLSQGGTEVASCSYAVDTPETDTCSIDGVPAGTYDVTIVAENANGTSSSATTTVTVLAAPMVPDPPTNVAATSGANQATISWTPPSNDGGSPVTSYTATAFDGDGNSLGSCTSTVTSPESDTCVITGLAAGVTATVEVVATNLIGDSDPDSGGVTVTPTGLPGAPAAPLASVASPTSVAVTWVPNDVADLEGVTSYLVTAYDSSSNPAGTCTYVVADPETDTCTVTGLTSGDPYTFTVAARNSSGAGSQSPASDPATPAGPPDAPASVAATATGSTVVVTWTSPVHDNGSSVTGYRVVVRNSSGTQVGTCTYTVSLPATNTCTVTGLSDGNNLTVSATATNALGTSGPTTTWTSTGSLTCSSSTSVAIVDGRLFTSPDLSTWTAAGSSSSIFVNATGFGADGFVYGIGVSPPYRYHLIRVDKSNVRTDMGIVFGLPRSGKYYAADSDPTLGPDGTLFVSPGAGSNVVYAINIASRLATPVTVPWGFTVGNDLAVLKQGSQRWIFSVRAGVVAGFEVGGTATVAHVVPKGTDPNIVAGADGNSLVAFAPGRPILRLSGLITGTFAVTRGAPTSLPAGGQIDGSHCS